MTTRQLHENLGGPMIAMANPAAGRAGQSAVVTIRNPTGTVLAYRLKWGVAGAWQPTRLAPLSEMHHSCELDDGQVPPLPYIEFDRNGGGNGGYVARAIRLECRVQQSVTGGQPYTFRLARGGRLLDLCRGY